MVATGEGGDGGGVWRKRSGAMTLLEMKRRLQQRERARAAAGRKEMGAVEMGGEVERRALRRAWKWHGAAIF